MGIFDSLGGNIGGGSSEGKVAKLTPVGEQRLQMNNGSGKELDILRALKEMGPSTPAEIGRRIQDYDTDRIKHVLGELRSKEAVSF